MRSTLSIVGVILLVGAGMFGLPLALWLMTVNLLAGALVAVALPAGVWSMLRFLDRRQAWGRPKPGTETPDELWKIPAAVDAAATQCAAVSILTSFKARGRRDSCLRGGSFCVTDPPGRLSGRGCAGLHGASPEGVGQPCPRC